MMVYLTFRLLLASLGVGFGYPWRPAPVPAVRIEVYQPAPVWQQPPHAARPARPDAVRR